MTRITLSLLIACLLAIASLTACRPSPDTHDAGKDPVPISDHSEPEEETLVLSLPDIKIVNLDGESISGDDFAGEALTMINVFGTWCPPCIAELPYLQQISEEYSDQGVRVVGVMQDGVDYNLDPDEAIVDIGKTLLADAGATYTVILPEKTLTATFIMNMQYFPTTFFLDADGTLVKTVVGAKDIKDWRKELDGILAELS